MASITDQLSNPYNWSVEAVSSWLIEIGLSDYVTIFAENNIDGQTLLTAEWESPNLFIFDDNDRDKFVLAVIKLKSLISTIVIDIPLNSTVAVNEDEDNDLNDELLALKIAEEQIIMVSMTRQASTERETAQTMISSTSTSIDMPLSSRNYTLSVNQDDTLEKLARENSTSLDALRAANPTLSATQELGQGQIIYRPVIQALIENNAVGVSSDGSNLLPLTFDDKDLENYKQCLRQFFTMVDVDESGGLNPLEFKALLQLLNLYTLDDVQIFDMFLDLSKREDGESGFEDIFKYFRSLIIIEDTLSPSKLCLFQAMLTADHMNQCVLGGISQFINHTWTKFTQYRRYGQHGQLVMSSGDNIAVVTEGTYSLTDLMCWPDRLADTIVPNHAIIKGFQWCSKSQSDPGAEAGELIFPFDFDGYLPTEIASLQTLKYYGCSFANETQQKVSLLHRHEIEDFHYSRNYLDEYVLPVNHPSLERHGFAHLDCPHDHHTQSGYFVLGKIVNGDELHLTGFQIPARHVLYIPSNTIHSNDYLQGKWRTMLAAADIDRVILKKKRIDVDLPDIFSFRFT